MVVGVTTRRLLGRVFAFERLGDLGLKGLDAATEAFRVVGEQSTDSRFEARASRSLLPMIGRDQELALLLERWARAEAGEGQGVLLNGEAGIGKSRIIRALLDALVDEQHTRLRYQCSPYHADSALWPVVQQLNHAAGLSAGDPTDAALGRIEALLAQAGRTEGAALIADLLGFDGVERYGTLPLTPQVKRARTLAALVDQLLGLAARRPVLVVFEDVHWIDPTTLEMVGQALDRIADAPVLMLLTSRPDQQPRLAGHPHVTRLTLNRLSRAGVDAMVARLGGTRLPGETIDRIIARTDGVPLFVEEVTKAVLEASESGVPASLHDSLMARLDRITDVKETAQIAACIGREFDYPLLVAVAERPEPELQAALDRLAGAELIFRRGSPPTARYTFKHALVRDTAYASLLRRRRQELHGRIARILEDRFPETSEHQPDLLAHHFTEAGRTEEAIDYWRRAGERASASSANLEAIAYLSRGLELIAVSSAKGDLEDQELRLQMAIAVPFLASRGYSAPEVESAYQRAADLCRRMGRSGDLFPILRGLWNCYLVRSDLKRALELAEQIVALAEKQGDPHRRALSRRALGCTLLYLGRFDAACEQLSEGVVIDAAMPGSDDRAFLSLYAERAGVVCRTNLAFVLWHLGFPDRALRTVEEGFALARQFGHAHSIAYATVMMTSVRVCRRDFVEAVQWSETARKVSREHGLPQWLAMGMMYGGYAQALLGEHRQGLDLLHEGLSAWHGIGARLFDPYWLGCIAAVYFQGRRTDKAQAFLDEATAALESTDQTFHEPELLRLRGLILKTNGSVRESAKVLHEAIAVARSQNARSPELRAATSLARLWAEQGERRKAHDLLAPVYGWFTEGFDTADLEDAKRLLDDLA